MRGETTVGMIFLQLLFPLPHDLLIKQAKCIRLILLTGNIIIDANTNEEIFRMLEFILIAFAYKVL